MTVTTQKVWLVTGASRGFGAEIAKGVIAAGDKLIATARKIETLAYLGTDDNVFPVALDVTDEASARQRSRRRCNASSASMYWSTTPDTSSWRRGRGKCRRGGGHLSHPRLRFAPRHARRAACHAQPAVRPHSESFIAWRVPGLSRMGDLWLYEIRGRGITEALHAEVAPLGIKVTVIEPGFFRTDFLDEKSLIRTAASIDDYHKSVGATRSAADEYNHQQPGDPAKLAYAIIELANAAEPPLRLPLGTDAMKRIEEKNAFVEKETSSWRQLSSSTDF